MGRLMGSLEMGKLKILKMIDSILRGKKLYNILLLVLIQDDLLIFLI